jgi:hypothetical protein
MVCLVNCTVLRGYFQKFMGESSCRVSISIAMLFIAFLCLMNVVENIKPHNNHQLFFSETKNSKSFAAVQCEANGETFAAMGAKMIFIRIPGDKCQEHRN